MTKYKHTLASDAQKSSVFAFLNWLSFKYFYWEKNKITNITSFLCERSTQQLVVLEQVGNIGELW